MRPTSCFIVALIGFIPALAMAVNFQDGRLQLHGFASQAIVNTSANRYFGDSTETSFDFTELGINASYQIDSRFLLSGQILVRRAGEMYDGTPSLDYALIDSTLVASPQHRFGVRLGRIKNSLGLYNDTRDVPFTRPGIFLPQVVYYDKVRNLLLSSDGIMFFGESFWDAGTLSLVLGAGQMVIDENAEWTYLGDNYAGDFEPNGPTWTASAWFTSPAERLKLGLSMTASSLAFDTAPRSLLEDGEIDFMYYIGSAQYNAQNWTLSAEYARQPLTWNDFGPFFPFDEGAIEGYYLQGEYRLGPTLQGMLRYEEGYADRHDRDGTKASALTGGTTPPFDFYSKIWTAGLRWDINTNTMLRLEYQRHQGTFALSIRENQDTSQRIKDWDVFAASISLRF